MFGELHVENLLHVSLYRVTFDKACTNNPQQTTINYIGNSPYISPMKSISYSQLG